MIVLETDLDYDQASDRSNFQNHFRDAAYP